MLCKWELIVFYFLSKLNLKVTFDANKLLLHMWARGRNGGYDAAKDMVTVKGTMDVKELVPFLANSSNEP